MTDLQKEVQSLKEALNVINNTIERKNAQKDAAPSPSHATTATTKSPRSRSGESTLRIRNRNMFGVLQRHLKLASSSRTRSSARTSSRRTVVQRTSRSASSKPTITEIKGYIEWLVKSKDREQATRTIKDEYRPFTDCIITGILDDNNTNSSTKFIAWKPRKSNSTLDKLQRRSQDKLNRICNEKIKALGPEIETFEVPQSIKDVIARCKQGGEDKKGQMDSKSVVKALLDTIDDLKQLKVILKSESNSESQTVVYRKMKEVEVQKEDGNVQHFVHPDRLKKDTHDRHSGQSGYSGYSRSARHSRFDRRDYDRDNGRNQRTQRRADSRDIRDGRDRSFVRRRRSRWDRKYSLSRSRSRSRGRGKTRVMSLVQPVN